MPENPRGRNLRIGRYSTAGQIYAITAVTKGRVPHLNDFLVARSLIKVLREEQLRGRADTLAFVVMPDHLHWLMQLSPTARLSSVVRDVKAVHSKRVGHALWQKGFHDHALRKEEDLQGWARYIVANPLRAGLVERIGEYPHWDAVWLS